MAETQFICIIRNMSRHKLINSFSHKFNLILATSRALHEVVLRLNQRYTHHTTRRENRHCISVYAQIANCVIGITRAPIDTGSADRAR